MGIFKKKKKVVEEVKTPKKKLRFYPCSLVNLKPVIVRDNAFRILNEQINSIDYSNYFSNAQFKTKEAKSAFDLGYTYALMMLSTKTDLIRGAGVSFEDFERQFPEQAAEIKYEDEE